MREENQNQIPRQMRGAEGKFPKRREVQKKKRGVSREIAQMARTAARRVPWCGNTICHMLAN